MAKVISGTRGHKGFHQVSGPTNPQKRFRCKCGGMAIPVPDGKGSTKLRCSQCMSDYTSKPIDS